MCGWAAVGTHRGLGTSSCYLPWVPTVKLLQTIHWALLSNRVGTAVVPGGSLLGSLGVKVGIVPVPSGKIVPVPSVSSVVPSSLCAGTHCELGACENGAGQAALGRGACLGSGYAGSH